MVTCPFTGAVLMGQVTHTKTHGEKEAEDPGLAPES
jgi:hypothetical protein